LAAQTLISRLKRILAASGAAAAFVLAAGAVTLAPERAREQDEAALWRSLASSYLQSGDVAGWSGTPPALSFASFVVEQGPEFGARIVERPLDDLRSFEAVHLDSARSAARERRCLAEAIYYEARSEGFAGQLAVAEVVLNRMRHRAYPSTICGVVYQGSERRTGCQFSFTCDGSIERAPGGRSWRRSQLVAEHALMGFARPVTASATHYHTIAVNPVWNESLVLTRRIGTHIFYRFPNRSERELLTRDREA
jgi:spore germination cell wall hydrolase CwlJ-like protein